MTNQRASVAMTDAELRMYLAAPRTLTLVANGPDGIPDPVPMWYVPAPDGSMLMRTYAKSQKVVNLRRDPRVAALIEDGSRYVELRGVQLTGRIELSTDVDLICDIFADLMIRYEHVDPATRQDVIDAYRPRAAKQVAMRLLVDRVVSWDHRKQVGG
jgi:PPOX class probable F420-dependent enzyme